MSDIIDEHRYRLPDGRLPVTRRLAFGVVGFLTVCGFGVISIMATQDVGLGDAAYFVIITVFAVGFAETIELNDTGRVLASGLIVLGVGSFTFLTVNFIEFLVEGHVLDIVGRRRMEREIESMQNHMIICGFGRVGRQAADDLLVGAGDKGAKPTPMVVIDPDPDRIRYAAAKRVAYVEGNATHESALHAAGIERARGLAACTADDAENVLIALTAKLMRPDIYIVLRLKDPNNAAKAFQAGADRVIAPTEIGGHRIAALLTKPAVVDFLDVVTRASDVDLVLEEITLRPGASLVGRTLIEARLRDTYGANVVAIKPKGGTLSTRPDPSTALSEGATLVVIGAQSDLERLAADNA